MNRYFNQLGALYKSIINSPNNVIYVLLGVVCVISILWFIAFAVKKGFVKALFFMLAITAISFASWKVGDLIHTVPFLFGLPSLLIGGFAFIVSPFAL